jgi:hypothetical protein
MIKEFVKIIVPCHFCCDPFMEVPQCCRLFQMLQVDDFIFPPEFHLLMTTYTVLDVTFDEKLLVQWVHVVDDVLYVEWCGNQRQRLHTVYLMLQKIS